MDESVRKLRLESRYKFVDRSKGSEELLYVLAGFREFLWPMVFERLIRYLPDGIDVCILSAGVHSEKLEFLCSEYDWSYLSTEVRDLGRAQNIAIHLHPHAKMIYKMDEDMFLTKNSFEALKETYADASKRWDVGFAAPLIPVNGYGYVRVLDLAQKAVQFEAKFGAVKYIWCHDDKIGALQTPIWSDAEAAKFMWREIDSDAMSAKLAEESLKWAICPLRFNIGFILFSRELWEDMDYFWAYQDTAGVGGDEEYLASFIQAHEKVIVVSENTVVGHFAAGGQQTEGVKAYMQEHPEKFALDKKYR